MINLSQRTASPGSIVIFQCKYNGKGCAKLVIIENNVPIWNCSVNCCKTTNAGVIKTIRHTVKNETSYLQCQLLDICDHIIVNSGAYIYPGSMKVIIIILIIRLIS